MERARAAWSTITLAYVIGVTAAVIGRDMKREHDRAVTIATDTTAYLTARADDIASRIDRMRSSEHSATYDRTAWGEPIETKSGATRNG